MAKEEVNIRVSSNVAEAIRLWKAMEEGPKAMGNELAALGRKGQQANSGIAAGLGNIAGRWLSVGTAIGAAAKLYGDLTEAAQRARVETEQAAVSLNTAMIDLFKLSGARREISDIGRAIHDTAIARKVKPERATEAAGALLGAGMTPEDVFEGGALDATLQVLSANSQTGKSVDTKGLVDAITGALSATGQTATKENILAAGVAMQNLWAGTKLELSDMPVATPRMKGIFEATGLGVTDQMAMLSQLRDVSSPDVGMTSLASGVNTLQNAGNVNRHQELLGEIGVTAEEVDMVGEDVFGAIARLNEGFKSVDEATAKRVRAGLFGSEGRLFAAEFISDPGIAKTEERRRMARNKGLFTTFRDATEGSFEAQDNEAAAKGSKLKFDESLKPGQAVEAKDDTVKTNLLRLLEERGDSPYGRSWAAGVYDRNRNNRRTQAQAAEAAAMASAGFSEITNDKTFYEGSLWQLPFRRMESHESIGKRAFEESKATVPEPVKVNVDVRLIDQNGLRLPARTEVLDVGKNAAGRR